MAVNMFAKSTISGSRAAFVSTVRPRANAAAIKTFSVAPTLGKGNRTRFPIRCPTAAKYPSLTVTWAPIFSKAAKWKFTGRAPMAHPPGNDTWARPRRAKSGPITTTLARIRRTKS
jgi:hypothetical protein